METSTFHYSTTSQSIHPKEDITDHQSAINFGTRPGHSPACYFISTPTSLFCSFHFFFFSTLSLSFSSSSFFLLLLFLHSLHKTFIHTPFSIHTLHIHSHHSYTLTLTCTSSRIHTLLYNNSNTPHPLIPFYSLYFLISHFGTTTQQL